MSLLSRAGSRSRLWVAGRVGSNQQLRSFYGHRSDEFYNCRAVW
jgi:hypothetical protein